MTSVSSFCVFCNGKTLPGTIARDRVAMQPSKTAPWKGVLTHFQLPTLADPLLSERFFQVFVVFTLSVLISKGASLSLSPRFLLSSPVCMEERQIVSCDCLALVNLKKKNKSSTPSLVKTCCGRNMGLAINKIMIQFLKGLSMIRVLHLWKTIL